MSRVTDKSEARDIVLDAFRHPVGYPIVVAVGEDADATLRSQLGIKNVRQDLVRTIVNELISEGQVEKTEDSIRPSVSTVGDPKPQKAFRYELVNASRDD